MAEHIRSASSHRPGPPSRGTCPTCGVATDGVHIAGNVYDYQCGPCVAQTDAGFDAFLNRLFSGEVVDNG